MGYSFTELRIIGNSNKLVYITGFKSFYNYGIQTVKMKTDLVLQVPLTYRAQSLASTGKIFSTTKLVRPPANSFQMFGRHG